MRIAIVAFAAGIAWLQWQPSLLAVSDFPALSIIAALAALSLLLAGLARTPVPWLPWRAVTTTLGVLLAFLLGIAWANWLAQARLADALPVAAEGRDIVVVGVVAGLPQSFENGLRFDFDVETAATTLPSRLSLAWYRGYPGSHGEQDDDVHAAPALHAGERWRLRVRLKRPHGNFNPHGFDDEGNTRLDDFVTRPSYVVEQLREVIRERYVSVLGDPRAGGAAYGGVLQALAIGDQRAIEPELWRIFARTGVTHLMSISGLHVTMIAGLVWWLVSWLWRRSSRLPLLLPAQKAAALAGFVGALAYCLLAGFAVPAQRTLYMLGVVALALWSGRTASGSRILALALLVVLLLDPWAVLAAGFWLSFGAVGLLFYISAGRLSGGYWLAAWARAQWAVTLGMIPALLALFQQFSLSSPLANAVAIPVVSFLVTPLALVGALPLADPLLWLAHWILSNLMLLLEWLADAPWAIWQQHAPRGFPARWLGLVALLPLFLLPPERPEAGVARIVTLDVGQGLAVHVQTATHDLLFDTGPAFSFEANSGNRIIVPYLRATGVRRLDGMIVSHTDIDHSGGALSVSEEVPIGWLRTSLAANHVISALPVPNRWCVDGETWTWDDVRFEMLHPTADDYSSGQIHKSNDFSCVLKVTAAGRSMLLTSDIEALSEAALLARWRQRLAADVLLVPHHGSRTSSTPEFVAAVGAHEAIFPVGYRNRFGHPRADVVARYDGNGARLWRTDRDGALTVNLAPSGVTIAAERAKRRRYWHGL